MAGIKITDLGSGGALQGTDKFPVARGNNLTRYILGSSLLDPLTNLSTKVNQLSGRIDLVNVEDARLSTLINQLSSDVKRVMNVPYARIMEPVGRHRDPSVYSLMATQYLFEDNNNKYSRNFLFDATPSTYIDDIGITKHEDGGLQFPVGTYDIKTTFANCESYGFYFSCTADMVDQNNNTILIGPGTFGWATYDNNLCVDGRFKVTNASLKYYIRIVREVIYYYGYPRALVVTGNSEKKNASIVTAEFWKIA